MGLGCIFIYLRSGGREPSGYPYGLALLVQAGTSPGWGPAAVGADRPCTPPCARAFGGARSRVPPTFICPRASARPHTAVVSLEGRSSDPVGGAMTAPGVAILASVGRSGVGVISESGTESSDLPGHRSLPLSPHGGLGPRRSRPLVPPSLYFSSSNPPATLTSRVAPKHLLSGNT